MNPSRSFLAAPEGASQFARITVIPHRITMIPYRIMVIPDRITAAEKGASQFAREPRGRQEDH